MKYWLFAFSILSLAACDPYSDQCRNTNPVFTRYTPHDSLYRTELIKQLNDTANKPIVYFIEGYLRENGKEYVLVRCESMHLCADALMLVNHWGRLADVRRTKSLGYHGARLAGLQYTIDDSSKILVYQDVEHIID